jgi:hypothetical protein
MSKLGHRFGGVSGFSFSKGAARLMRAAPFLRLPAGILAFS